MYINNEVIVFRMIMYANPLLTVQAMYSTFKGQSVFYILLRCGEFLKIIFGHVFSIGPLFIEWNVRLKTVPSNV